MAKKVAKRGGKRPGAGRKPEHPEGKTTKIVANVPDSLVKKLEKLAEKKDWSRSAAVTEAIRRFVKRGAAGN